MTSNMQGMDTDYARQISGQMDSHASAVSDQCTKLLARITGTSWVGTDRDKITDEIGHQFMPNAQQFCDDMRQQVGVPGETDGGKDALGEHHRHDEDLHEREDVDQGKPAVFDVKAAAVAGEDEVLIVSAAAGRTSFAALHRST